MIANLKKENYSSCCDLFIAFKSPRSCSNWLWKMTYSYSQQIWNLLDTSISSIPIRELSKGNDISRGLKTQGNITIGDRSMFLSMAWRRGLRVCWERVVDGKLVTSPYQTFFYPSAIFLSWSNNKSKTTRNNTMINWVKETHCRIVFLPECFRKCTINNNKDFKYVSDL